MKLVVAPAPMMVLLLHKVLLNICMLPSKRAVYLLRTIMNYRILAQSLPGVVAYHAASKQTDQGIILLHKIVEGVARGSFGMRLQKRSICRQKLSRGHNKFLPNY